MIYLNLIRWDIPQFWQLLLNNGEVERAWLNDLLTGEDWFSFDNLFLFGLTYFIIDVLWILLQPEAFKIPISIMLHHGVVLLYLCFLYISPQYYWFMGACLFVELNTWIMIVRRLMFRFQLPQSISIHTFVEAIFYLTGMARVIWFVYLLRYEIYVYGRDAHMFESPYNIIFWGIVNQTGLVLMSLHYAGTMAMNLLKKQPTQSIKDI